MNKKWGALVLIVLALLGIFFLMDNLRRQEIDADKTNNQVTTVATIETTQETNQTTTTTSEPSAMIIAPTGQTFTKDSLKEFDGKEGRKAYIALDGKVYDVSEVPMWANGQHNGVEAGRDVSEDFKLSPHTKEILNNAKEIGVYQAD